MSYDRSTQALDVRGAALAYSDDGAGPLAFYAHGLTASRAVDGRLDLPRFAGLRRAVRLVAYDARGHGESSGGRDPAEYAWSALAEDMHAVLDHFSPDAPASVIGLSMGTGTLLHAAVARPARFARLVLTAPPTAWETRAQQSEMYATLAALAETEPPDKLASLFQQRPIAPIFRDLPPPPPPGLPDITLERMPAVFRGAGRSDLPAPEALRTLAQPTLILAWDTDPGHPVSTAQRLAELIPNARLHVSKTVEDIGSWGRRIAQFLGASPEAV